MDRVMVRDINDNLVEVRVGTVVGFKYDIEQYAAVEEIRRSGTGGTFLLVTATEGGYIDGPTKITLHSDDVWID